MPFSIWLKKSPRGSQTQRYVTTHNLIQQLLQNVLLLEEACNRRAWPHLNQRCLQQQKQQHHPLVLLLRHLHQPLRQQPSLTVLALLPLVLL